MYSKIKDTIPTEWKMMLKGEGLVQNCDLLHTIKCVNISYCEFTLNNVVELKNLKQRDLYYMCAYQPNIPICIDSWCRVWNQLK